MGVPLRIMAFALVWIIVGGTASAQPAPVSAVVPAQGEAASHGWAVIERDAGPMLVHIQPRESGPGYAAADPGSVRPVRPLVEMPDGLAAIGDRVYLLYAPGAEAEPAQALRPVFSLRTVPSVIAGMWVDLPSGLMDTLPALPAQGRLIGVAASPSALFVLERSPGRLGLWSLQLNAAPAEWTPIEVPVDIAGDEPLGVAIVSLGDGILIAIRGTDETRSWSLDAAGKWETFGLLGWDRFWSARWRHGFGHEVLIAQAIEVQGAGPSAGASPALELWRLGTSEPVRVGSLGASSPGAIVSLPVPGRVVMIRPGTSDASTGREGAIGIEEISLVTGRSLHSGPGGGSVAVPVNELRAITLILVLMMAGVLIVIIRPNPERAWTIPAGWVLADPGRRMIASMLDVVLVVIVLAPAFGVTPRQVLTLEVLIHPTNAWLILPSTLVAGWISMSVWESLLGLTPGKFVMGCRVWLAKPGAAGRVPLFWCLVRNAMKWLTPPVAAIALFDPEGRHRGDAAARAVVVSRALGGADAGDP